MDGDSKINAFWSKCLENRAVSEYAYNNGHLNAAASRYYYALFLGFCSLFEKKGIPVPEYIYRDGKSRKNPYLGTWPKRELHKQAKSMIQGYKYNIEYLLQDAFILRVRADYESMPVKDKEIESIREKTEEIFKMIEDEIKQN